MVNYSPSDTKLIRELGWQNVYSPLSHVRPIACPVDSMRRHVQTEPTARSKMDSESFRLGELRALLEWAYGYRMPNHARQRLTRRAPSAGGLYPTETLVVTDVSGSWQVLYYHYASHRYHVVPVAQPAALAKALGLTSGEDAVLLVSVLWRTLQRYGVRGYRYCLLDAGNVAYNLMRGAQAHQHEMLLTPQVLTPEVENLLELHEDEALMLVLRSRPNAGSRVQPPPLLPGELIRLAETTEHPPALSPVLRRAISFHKQTLTHEYHCEVAPRIEPHETEAEFAHWAIERYSPREFTAGSVSSEAFQQMTSRATAAPIIGGEHSPELLAYAITTRVNGMPIGVSKLSQYVGKTGFAPFSSAEELATQLSAACQGQKIMKGTAFSLVLAVRKTDLAATGHVGFRHAVLNAGLVCADLYREAAGTSLGTTSIGGFSDHAVSDLLGDPSIVPIVVQSFGTPAESGEKVDAVRIAGLGSTEYYRRATPN